MKNMLEEQGNTRTALHFWILPEFLSSAYKLVNTELLLWKKRVEPVENWSTSSFLKEMGNQRAFEVVDSYFLCLPDVSPERILGIYHVSAMDTVVGVFHNLASPSTTSAPPSPLVTLDLLSFSWLHVRSLEKHQNCWMCFRFWGLEGDHSKRWHPPWRSLPLVTQIPGLRGDIQRKSAHLLERAWWD